MINRIHKLTPNMHVFHGGQLIVFYKKTFVAKFPGDDDNRYEPGNLQRLYKSKLQLNLGKVGACEQRDLAPPLAVVQAVSEYITV